MRGVVVRCGGLFEGNAERRDRRVDVRLNDEGLKENREQGDERKGVAPAPLCGYPLPASARPKHADVILYHSGLTQTPMKSVASGFDQ